MATCRAHNPKTEIACGGSSPPPATIRKIYLRDTRGELSAMIDVDKWALSSCLMWFSETFGSANLSLSTHLLWWTT